MPDGRDLDGHGPADLVPARARREGPKPRHSRTEIAAAAVRIADAEGIAAVTMRRVAAELGTGTMSLYNYVPAKEHLVQLMADQTAGEYTYPRRPPQDSREAIAGLGRQGRDIARRHPWLPAVMHRPPPMGPSTLRYIDYFLGLLGRRRTTHRRENGDHRDHQRLRPHVRRHAGSPRRRTRTHRHNRSSNSRQHRSRSWPKQRPAAATQTWPPPWPPHHPSRERQTRTSTPASAASSTARWPDQPSLITPRKMA